jgi:hypothetical protein
MSNNGGESTLCAEARRGWEGTEEVQACGEAFVLEYIDGKVLR